MHDLLPRLREPLELLLKDGLDSHKPGDTKQRRPVHLTPEMSRRARSVRIGDSLASPTSSSTPAATLPISPKLWRSP